MDAFRNTDREARAALERRVWDIVDRLPQREAIRTADATAWVDDVVAKHGEAALWHATRLGGFGGSEIGVLIRNRHGERADHGASAHDIVEAKLMRRAPLEETSHLRRGHENEDLHAQRFWAKWGAVRDVAAYEALKNAKGSHPWMRYSPDDVVRMPLRVDVGDDGRPVFVRTKQASLLWLIDYKAPSQVDASARIAMQYAAQLHQGQSCAQNTAMSWMA